MLQLKVSLTFLGVSKVSISKNFIYLLVLESLFFSNCHSHFYCPFLQNSLILMSHRFRRRRFSNNYVQLLFHLYISFVAMFFVSSTVLWKVYFPSSFKKYLSFIFLINFWHSSVHQFIQLAKIQSYCRQE